MRCFQTRAACSFGSVWIAICLSRNRGATMWKPVLRQHRARASCGGHVLVKVKLVLKDNAKWAYTRSGHTRNILVARICYLRDIDPFCPEPLRLDLIDPNATNYTTCCGLQQGAVRGRRWRRLKRRHNVCPCLIHLGRVVRSQSAPARSRIVLLIHRTWPPSQSAEAPRKECRPSRRHRL